MARREKITQAFFALLQAGLWERPVNVSPFAPLDFGALMRLGEEQSVLGLVTEGVELVSDVSVAKSDAIPFLQRVIAIENRNSAMNAFVAGLFERLRKEQINVLLVKGQGVAQCYARPQWRTPGDVDLLFDSTGFERAKSLLSSLASEVETDSGRNSRHQGMTIDDWTVELHETLSGGLSYRVNHELEAVQNDLFVRHRAREWKYDGMSISLPDPDSDIVIVFTHFLKHFYKGGIGLRQICDWCRLLWSFRESIDLSLLTQRLRAMGLMSEWRAFGVFAVEYLGMPVEAMPLYSPKAHWKRKARRICSFIMEVGNFGHNRDTSYYSRYPRLIRKVISFGRRVGDLIRHASVFPLDSIRFFFSMLFYGLRAVVRGG